MSVMQHREPEPKSKAETTIPAQKVCRNCSNLQGEEVPVLKDRKGIHVCARCRTSLTKAHADALPDIKAALRKKYGIAAA